MISLFQLWNLDDWDQRISFIFKGNLIGWKYLGFWFFFFYKFQKINFCIFSTKMDWDIIIRQLDFFFLQVNITECTFNFVMFMQILWTHFFVLFVNTFISCENLGDQYQIQAYSIQPLTQESMSNVNTHKYTCKMWVHKFVSNQVTISH